MPAPHSAGIRRRTPRACIAFAALTIASTLLAQHPPRDTIPAEPARAFLEALHEKPLDPIRIDRALKTIEHAVVHNRDCAEDQLIPLVWSSSTLNLSDRSRWRILNILEGSHNNAPFSQLTRQAIQYARDHPVQTAPLHLTARLPRPRPHPRRSSR